MPSRIPTACRCGQRDCQVHRATDDRASAARRGYDATWQRLRRLVLAEEPLCRPCVAAGRTTPAAHVHHSIPVREAPELRLVRSNLVPVCVPCHGRLEAEGHG
jgi:5-methylcytosine-specific restriction enzyme A